MNEKEYQDFKLWRRVLAGEWNSYGDSSKEPIPRYAIARMLGSPDNVARECIEE